MMRIKIMKTSIVKAAEKTPRQSIPLIPLDKVYSFPCYISTVHIYRPVNGTTIDAAVLRESLSKTLVHFYPAAGRCRLGGDGIMEIDCNDEGVPFVEAETESDLEALGDLAPSTDMSLLTPPIDDGNHDISYYPMFAVQVTYFKCGSVSVGVLGEHHCNDGSSGFQHIKSWSEIARGLEISTSPFLDRNLLLSPRNPPRPEYDHQEYSQYGPANLISNSSTSDVKVSVFRITSYQLDLMKADGDHHYSTFEILAGHIWKCVCIARGISDGEETRLTFPVDARYGNRWKPQLPRGFYGNAVFHGVSVVRVGDLKKEPLCWAAAEIQKTLIRMDNKYLRSAVDCLALLPGDPRAASKIGSHVYSGSNFQITSWAKMGLTDADFGWGPPIYIGPGNINYEKAYIFPSDHHGSLSVAIALLPQHMDMFENLFLRLGR